MDGGHRNLEMAGRDVAVVSTIHAGYVRLPEVRGERMVLNDRRGVNRPVRPVNRGSTRLQSLQLLHRAQLLLDAPGDP